MGNNVTELVFVLDRSGSMAGLEQDTIGGFNAMIEKQKQGDGECFVSTVLFNSFSQVIHDRIKVSEVPKMTNKEYEVFGCTALIDAIGGSIKHISNIHKYARPQDVPEHTLFVITTDGMENASRIFRSGEVKKLIENKKKEGWEFLFIGANIDAVETAQNFGIDEDRAVNYHADSLGTKVLYETMCEQITCVRNNNEIKSDWSARINEDFNNRK